MPAKNKFYKTFYTKKEHDDYIASVVSRYLVANLKPIEHARFQEGMTAGINYGIDMAILAIGRMRDSKKDISEESFIEDFMRSVEQASKDYCDLFDIDILENNDQQLWWSGAKMDEELRSYVGDDYPSFEERYSDLRKQKGEKYGSQNVSE